jgi:hypothetical protein
MRCVRCEEKDALVPGGYCADCLGEVHTEVEFGFFRFQEYLTRWSEFDAWCAANGRAA